MPSGLWHLDMDPRANLHPELRFRICLLLIRNLMINIPMVEDSVSRLSSGAEQKGKVCFSTLNYHDSPILTLEL